MIFYCFLVCQSAAACCRRLIAAAHSLLRWRIPSLPVSFKVNRKANDEADGAEAAEQLQR